MPLFGFHGEFQDSDSDRVHFYARSYDPTTGRFFQQDRVDGALTSPMTQHNYLYGFANPVTYSDYLGYWGLPKISISIPNPVKAVKSVAGKVVDRATAVGKAAWTHRHEILDVAGMVPVIGEVADAANAVLYLAEGDYANAAISLAALVPIGGQAVTGARLAYKGANAASDLVKYGDEVVAAGSNIVKRTRSASNAADTASSARTATRTADAATSGSRAASDTASTVASKTDELAAGSARASADKVDNVVPSSTPAAKPAANASAAPSKPVAAPKSQPAGRATTTPGNGPVEGLGSQACRANSFVPGTEVLLADGSTKPIELIELGERVWAADPVTGEIGPRPVIDLIVGVGLKQLVDITIDGETITATDGHPFWVDDHGRWVDAGDLVVGDGLVSADGDVVAIDAVVDRDRVATVHNLTVDGIHTFYVQVGDEPVLTHNCAVPANERFFRTMSEGDFGKLRKTGRLPGTSETFISPTESYARRYNGVLVEFNVRSGTTSRLADVGVRDVAAKTIGAYPNLPVVSSGRTGSSAYFKFEDNQLNIGLGRGKALEIFNDSIVDFRRVGR